MNLRRLKYFIKIVDTGSLTQAAEVLHIAQPALSQQVATLESEMGKKLLIRTKRGVTPTESGQMLYAHARIILRQCEQAQIAVTHAGYSLNESVTVGLAPGAADSSLITPLLQIIHENLPDVALSVLEDNSTVLNEKLMAGHIDMALLYENASSGGICRFTLMQEELYLAGTEVLPGKTIDLAEVEKMKIFMLRRYSAVRKKVEEAFLQSGLSATISDEIESMSMLAAAVSAGMGVTILPGEAASKIAAMANNIWIAKIHNPLIQIPLSLHIASAHSLSPSAQAIKSILLSQLNRTLYEREQAPLANIM